MDEIKSVEKYLLLPDAIISNKSSFNNKINLLSERFIKQYYYADLRKNLLKYFDKYNDLLIYFNSMELSKALNSNTIKVENKQKSNNNEKKEKNEQERIDAQIWVNNFYNVLLDLSTKLTYRESIYLVKSLFLRLSEKVITEKLCISRSCLQRIKKSVLVKIYLTFKENKLIKNIIDKEVNNYS